MNDQMQTGMAEATRLTREGRLAEATEAIQRALRGEFSAADAPSGAGGPAIEVPSRLVDGTSRPAAPPRPEEAGQPLRPAPRPPRSFRNVPPGTLPFTTPGEPAGSDAPTVTPAGGRFVERSYTNRYGTRSYKLYVPSGYVGQEVPLIVMLHGCTQNPDDFAAGTRMNALAEEHTFLVAYPAQAQGANMNKCWNWFEVSDQQRGRGEPSLIAGITCEVVGEHHVAAGKVYVAGMSSGGAMAAIMGEAYPDLYAAIGVHSGLPPGAARDLPSAFAAMRQGGPSGGLPNKPSGGSDRIVPTIVFHGDRDTTVHPRNAEHLLERYRNVASGPVVQVTKGRGQVPGGHAYGRDTHRDAAGRVLAEHWTVNGLGHAWSGGSAPGSYTDARGPDASAEMVRFFREHPQQEPAER